LKIKNLKRINIYKENLLQWILWVVLLILLISFSIASPVFFTIGNLFNILLQVTVIGILSIGMTFIIISKGIDLSIASLVAFTGVIAALFAKSESFGLFIPLFAAIFSGAIAACILNGIVIAYGKITPFIATLASMMILRGVVLVITGTKPIFPLNSKFNYIGAGMISWIPFPVIIFIILFIAAFIFQNNFRFAKYIFAIGDNFESAVLSGLKVKNIQLIIYTANGALAGLAGAILAGRIGAGEPNIGQGLEMTVIAAVVIGGTSLFGGKGSVQRSLVGVLILGVIANGLTLLNISSYYQDIVKGVIILCALLNEEWLLKQSS
jgi:ribose/xylose/arabinose/galactoside ABC-type transport system permease subunit